MSNWRVIRDQLPVVHCWDGDYVVFAPLSGDTHILDMVGGEVLAAVQAGPVDAAAVYRRIGALLELPVDALLAERVDAILAELDHAGLIEQVD